MHAGTLSTATREMLIWEEKSAVPWRTFVESYLVMTVLGGRVA